MNDPNTPPSEPAQPGEFDTGATATAHASPHDPPPGPPSAPDDVDLDAVERELDAVQAALDRLNDGTYWTDEVTGEPLPEHVLEADPTARTATDA